MSDPEPKLKPRCCPPPAELLEFFVQHESLTVLTGAGCSTECGIPDYRDDAGNWKHRKPIQYAEFLASASARRRYWARSFAGWQRIADARPGRAHMALARLEQDGRIRTLITQNVDDLHRRAGSRNVIDLHGVLQRVRCVDCGAVQARRQFQERLSGLNSHWHAAVEEIAPDGDARLAERDFSDFMVPPCDACNGTLKPDVVFFGEAVPSTRVEQASASLRQSDALLVVGSSLMVFSGFRFARLAASLGKPVAIVNRGKTRADGLAIRRVTGDCGTILAAVAEWFNKEKGIDARGMDGRL